MLDIDALAEEFNIPKSVILDDGPNQPAINIKATDINDPDLIVANNISKANALLDHVIKEIESGNFSPRMVEVAGLLINAINGSTSQLYSKSFEIANIHLKAKALQLKEKQINMIERTSSSGRANVVITDRETVLRMLRENDSEQKQIENVIDIENEGK